MQARNIILTIVIGLTPILSHAQFTISSKSKPVAKTAVQKMECNQLHSQVNINVRATTNPIERMVSATTADQGAISNVEAFSNLLLELNKTGAASTFIEIKVDNRVVKTLTTSQSNFTNNIMLNNVRGKSVHIKIINLSALQNKTAAIDVSLKGLTTSLFKRGYSSLNYKNGSFSTTALTMPACSRGALIIVEPSNIETKRGSAEYAEVVVTKNGTGSGSTELERRPIKANFTKEEIFIQSGCSEEKLSVRVEYKDSNNKIHRKFKVTAHPAEPLGYKKPGAVHHAE